MIHQALIIIGIALLCGVAGMAAVWLAAVICFLNESEKTKQK